jgi:hypothetical protein
MTQITVRAVADTRLIAVPIPPEIKGWTDGLSQILAGAVGVALPCSFWLDDEDEIPPNRIGWITIQAAAKNDGSVVVVRPPPEVAAPPPAAPDPAERADVVGIADATPIEGAAAADQGSPICDNPLETWSELGSDEHATLVPDDLAGSDFGSEPGESGRASSTVRSDYGEESGGEDAYADEDAAVQIHDGMAAVNLPVGNLLQMVAAGTLPDTRTVIPNWVGDVGRYASMVKVQIAVELHAQIAKERKVGKKQNLELTPKVRPLSRDLPSQPRPPTRTSRPVLVCVVPASHCSLPVTHHRAVPKPRCGHRGAGS